MRIVSVAHGVPVQQVLAELTLPACGGRGEARAAVARRRRMGVGIERRLGFFQQHDILVSGLSGRLQRQLTGHGVERSGREGNVFEGRAEYGIA